MGLSCRHVRKYTALSSQAVVLCIGTIVAIFAPSVDQSSSVNTLNSHALGNIDIKSPAKYLQEVPEYGYLRLDPNKQQGI